MPTSWKRADDSVLRAHLQEALGERDASREPADWSYSDYEVAAIRAELAERRDARERLRQRLDSPGGIDEEARARSVAPADPDLERLRTLLARCWGGASRDAAPRLAR